MTEPSSIVGARVPAQAATEHADKLAKISMFLGLGSLLCACLTGIPALILGVMAWGNASPSGKKQAIIGIAMGGGVTALGLIFFGIVAAGAQSDRNGGTPTTSSIGTVASSAPVAVQVEVQCRHVDKTVTVLCPSKEDPACLFGDRAHCRAEYLNVLEDEVNNWEKSGTWSKLKGRVTFVDLEVKGREVRKGKTCFKSSRNAAIWLCSEKLEEMNPNVKRVVGFGILDSYKQGLLQDTLMVTLLEVFKGDEAERQRALMRWDQVAATLQEPVEDDTLVTLDELKNRDADRLNDLRQVALLRGLPIDGLFERAAVAARKSAEAKSAAETARRADMARRSPAQYPALCTDLKQDTHVPVKGSADLCIPKHQSMIIASAMGDNPIAETLPSVPERYDDSDPIATLLSPNAVAGETSSMTAAERGKVAAGVKAKTWYLLEKAAVFGEWKHVELAEKLAAEVDLSQIRLYSGASPQLKKTEKCEMMTLGRCEKRCTSNSDCMGLMCGCEESVCSFFQCSPCRGERICDDPKFELLSSPWKLSKRVATEQEKSAAGSIASDRDVFVVFQFQIVSAWRNVSSKKRDDGESGVEVAHDTGYYVGVKPLLVGLMRCPDLVCGRLSEPLFTMQSAGQWTTEMSHGGNVVRVRCVNGICEGELITK